MSIAYKNHVENKDEKTVSKRDFCRTKTSGKSKTRQEFTKECDINHIIAKHLKMGQAIEVDTNANYTDVSNIPAYEEMLTKVIVAKQSFNRLDNKVREKFHNNPNELMDFLKNKDNYDEAVKLGLVNKKEKIDKDDKPLTMNQLKKLVKFEKEPPEPTQEPSPEDKSKK